MAEKKKKLAAKKTKYSTEDGHRYLTKRFVVRKTRIAGKKAASNAMQTTGFVVVAEGNQIIKRYANGSEEIVADIEE